MKSRPLLWTHSIRVKKRNITNSQPINPNTYCNTSQLAIYVHEKKSLIIAELAFICRAVVASTVCCHVDALFRQFKLATLLGWKTFIFKNIKLTASILLFPRQDQSSQHGCKSSRDMVSIVWFKWTKTPQSHL